jgi:dienelactone hydrolase
MDSLNYPDIQDKDHIWIREIEMADAPYEFDRVPLLVQFEEAPGFSETYGFAGSQGMVNLEGQLLKPRGRESESVLLFMHPSSTLNLMPMPAGMARAGYHVMCCASRYAKNDSALIMEKVALDMGAYVRFAKEEMGYKDVVLVGWSGGGSLSLFYQSQAENPTITQTPAGDPVDLTSANLIPVDGTMFVAAHISRAKTLTEWMDPSVLDETRPDDRVLDLDLYNPDNPNQPAYEAAFLDRYRAAQIDRNRRITAWVRNMLDELGRRSDGETERGFVVHRTMADPRWLDPLVDPNDRRPGWCFLGEPRTVNVGPVGLARFCTLRSWLSQWSYDESRADGPDCAKGISVPFLSVINSADDAAPANHTTLIHQSAASADKTSITIKGANHYYKDQPELMTEAVAACGAWLEERNLA